MAIRLYVCEQLILYTYTLIFFEVNISTRILHTLRLQETQSSHEVIQQQYVQSSTARTQLQTELQQLRQELQRRESLVTNTLAEKAALEGRVQSCQEELEAVKEELRMATEQHLETVRSKIVSTI